MQKEKEPFDVELKLLSEDGKDKKVIFKGNIADMDDTKINFNEKFISIDKNNEEKMLEALIYSLTEISHIKGIMIIKMDKKTYYVAVDKIEPGEV